MEKWQIEIIFRQLPYLPLFCKCNTFILANLSSSDLLSAAEILHLKDTWEHRGSYALVLELMVRSTLKQDAFDKLIAVLDVLYQTDAAQLLKREKDAYFESLIDKALAIPEPVTVNMITEEWCFWNCWHISKEQINVLKSEYKNETGLHRLLQIPNEFHLKKAKASDFVENDFVVQLKRNEPESCGLALIINITVFSSKPGKPNNNRPGSECDVIYLRSICKALGYKIWNEHDESGNFTRLHIIELLNDFLDECLRVKPMSILIFVGSHGEYGRIFTSDSWWCARAHKSIDPMREIIAKFCNNERTGEALEKVPKIFLVNACQCFPPMQSDHTVIEGTLINNAVICYSQFPGGKSWRCPVSGSWFVHSFAFCLSRLAQTLDFVSIMQLVVETLQERQGIAEENENDATRADTTKREYSQVASFFPIPTSLKIVFRK